MNEIPPRYTPKEAEDKWYRFWEERNFFAAKPDSSKKPFTIVIPPPNVTGILHMGHALNNTIQDILVRYHRMKGEESLWMPGTDHAGIATQNVVERDIARQGLKREDLGREKFLERVWQWKEQYGSTIIQQLKKLGASCDWSRTRFTMDEGYSRAVRSVFVALWEKGLIYRGDKIINWCPRCQTALSDEEAPHREISGALYYIRYPLKQSTVHSPPSTVKNKSVDHGPSTVDHIVVATTRPETMLGDTAVAVNPKDKRFKSLIGKQVVLPLMEREIKIIADKLVDPKFGTGLVKVTPAHDPNDYDMGKRHKLDFINIMHPDGRLNKNAGEYANMDRFEAREAILEDLKERGLLEKVEEHKHAVGHCYRCHSVIEPYLSRQWFVKMKPLAKPAIAAVKKGKIKFYPKRWTKVYLNWMENIQDWCISRQIWWGHRLPVYYCKKCLGAPVPSAQCPSAPVPQIERKPTTNGQQGIIVSLEPPRQCPGCGSTDIYQDEDVLDTWFSSWLWPFATFGWPFTVHSPQSTVHSKRSQATSYELRTDLDYFYPTSVLVTAPEIIFFWVARMIMAGIEFIGDIPFKDVYIHGTVRDIEGKKMSKSLGNIIDPLEIINQYGADALRFSIISITAQGQDVFLSPEKFEMGRNFANKIWNASRFVLMNLKPEKVNYDLCTVFAKENLDIWQRWILSRFYSTLKQLDRMLKAYRFNEGANLLYGFFWHDFCDWYLEIAKLKIEDSVTQLIMFKVLEKSIRLLHPFMPFITEEIWQKIQRPSDPATQGSSIMMQPWPHLQEQMIDKKTEQQAEVILEIIREMRNLRSQIGLKNEQKVTVSLYAHTKSKQDLIAGSVEVIKSLVRLEKLEFLAAAGRPQATVSAVVGDVDIYLHFTGLLEIGKEQQKIKEEMHEKGKLIVAKKALLKNPQFIKNAPKEVVEETQKKIEELEHSLKRLEKMYNELL